MVNDDEVKVLRYEVLSEVITHGNYFGEYFGNHSITLGKQQIALLPRVKQRLTIYAPYKSLYYLR